jgi:hypothetical protein
VTRFPIPVRSQGSLPGAEAGPARQGSQGGSLFQPGRWHDDAEKAGDKKVAKMFRQIAADEGDHYQQFKEAFVKLTNTPASATAEKEKRDHHE